MVEVPVVGAAVVGVLLVALLGWWLRGDDDKYDDPEAQRAHGRAQARDPDEVAPVGMETTTVVQELVDSAGRTPAGNRTESDDGVRRPASRSRGCTCSSRTCQRTSR